MEQGMRTSRSKARCGELEHTHLMKFWNQAMCLQAKTGQDLAKWKVGPSVAHNVCEWEANSMGNLQINNEIVNVRA